MFDLHSRTLMVKIVLGVVLGMVSFGMLLYLVPMPRTPLSSGEGNLADVAGERITVADVQRQLNQISQQQPIPDQMRGFYAQQIFDRMVFNRLLEVEAARLGIGVSDAELAQQIRAILPQAFPNGKWVGTEQYAALVQQGFGLSVADFEDDLRQSILQQKFQQLVTAGITVSPEAVRQEFQRRNEKVKMDYVSVDPSALAAKLQPADSDLEAWYRAHESQYQVPEERSADYLLLDLDLLRKNTTIPQDQLLADYNQNINQYKVPDRVHVEHILFMTIGKTDAEIAEIKKKAQSVLDQLQHGADFSKLAKQYSEDPGSKDKGGDLGWIVRQQTVPAFEKVAFSLPVGQMSGLVQTQYGFHIIKVLGKETAHTKSFTDVKDQILQTLLTDKVQSELEAISAQMASVVRSSNRQSLAAVEAALGPQVQPDLVTGQTPLVSVTAPMGDLGANQDVRNAVFGQSVGQLSLPIRTSRGELILAVNKIIPAHQGAFAEVKDRVEKDYLAAKTADLARSEAGEVAARLRQGQKLDAVAKSLGLSVQTGDFSRLTTVAGAPARQFLAAFSAPVGAVEGPQLAGKTWIVYTITAHEEPSDADFARQRDSIRQELLGDEQTSAFDAFRRALEDQMKRDGQLTISEQNLKSLTNPSQS